jgi:hypothetical protein
VAPQVRTWSSAGGYRGRTSGPRRSRRRPARGLVQRRPRGRPGRGRHRSPAPRPQDQGRPRRARHLSQRADDRRPPGGRARRRRGAAAGRGAVRARRRRQLPSAPPGQSPGRGIGLRELGSSPLPALRWG